MHKLIVLFLITFILSIVSLNTNLVHAAGVNDYKENKLLSDFLNDQGFKFSHSPDEYYRLYRLAKEMMIRSHIYWFNEGETAESIGDGFTPPQPTPIKEGAFVVYIRKFQRERSSTQGLIVWKYFSKKDPNVSAMDVEHAFTNKYGLKDAQGKLLAGQPSSLLVRHGEFYLRVGARVKKVQGGYGELIVLQVLDETYDIRKKLNSKKKSKNIF